MIIRQLRQGDELSPAIALLQRFFAEEGFDTPPQVIEARTKTLSALDTCALLVAEELDLVVGVATVSSEFGLEFGWWAEMGDLYVVPEARGKGVALSLVEAVESWLRSRGISGYQVTVTPSGEAHHGLLAYYHKLGFNSEGRLLLFKQT